MTEFTGHDGDILAQALGYFIAIQAALPLEHKEYSNQCDAALIATSGMVSRERVAVEMVMAQRKLALLQGRPVGVMSDITQEIGEVQALLDHLVRGVGVEH